METPAEQPKPKNTRTSPPSSHNVALHARLSEFIEKKGDNFTRLARTLDLSPMFFHRFTTQKGSIGSEALMKIVAHYPELSTEWLFRGMGTMLVGTVYKEDVEHYHAVGKATDNVSAAIEKITKEFEKLDKENKKLQKLRKKSK